MTNKKYIVELHSGHRFVTQENKWNGMILGDDVKLKEMTVEPEQMMGREEPQNRFFWLLGNVVGDGTIVDSKQIIVATHNYHPKGNSKEEAREMAEYAKKCISDLRISTAKGWIVDLQGHKDAFRTSCQSKPIYSMCREYITDRKVVTHNIENSPLICQAQFLCGLFDADGHVEWQQKDETRRSIELAQSNPDLLRRAQRMLLNFGITSYIKLNRGYEKKKFPGGNVSLCKPCYTLRITREQNMHRYREFIGFVEPQKKSKLDFVLAHKFQVHQKVDFMDKIYDKFVVDDVDEETIAKFEDFAETIEHPYVKTHHYSTRKRRVNYSSDGKYCCKCSRRGF